MADDTTQDSTQGTTTNSTLSPTCQPNTTIAKQPGLTVRTSYVRGDWEQLKGYAEKAKVGLPPPVDTAWTGDFGTGNVTTLNLQREAGDRATLAIGMFANQGFNTLTDALGTIPSQSRNAKRLSNIGGGAIAGATAGAMLGPAGMAVGVAIGTAVGALKTLADEAKETRDALRSLKDSAKMTGYTTGAKRQDAAFVRSLQWMTRDQRDEAITERANQIKRGDGDTSVRSLTNAIEAMAKRGLTDTPAYKEKQNLLAMQKSRLATLGDLDDKNYFQNLPTLLKGSEHADALQKIGGQIGSTINVKDSDREMLNLLREISTSTRILATNAPTPKEPSMPPPASASSSPKHPSMPPPNHPAKSPRLTPRASLSQTLDYFLKLPAQIHL